MMSENPENRMPLSQPARSADGDAAGEDVEAGRRVLDDAVFEAFFDGLDDAGFDGFDDAGLDGFDDADPLAAPAPEGRRGGRGASGVIAPPHRARKTRRGRPHGRPRHPIRP